MSTFLRLCLLLPCLHSLFLLTCLWHLPGQVIYQTYRHSCLSLHNTGPSIPTCSKVHSLRKVGMGLNTYQGVPYLLPLHSTLAPVPPRPVCVLLFIATPNDQLFLWFILSLPHLTMAALAPLTARHLLWHLWEWELAEEQGCPTHPPMKPSSPPLNATVPDRSCPS